MKPRIVGVAAHDSHRELRGHARALPPNAGWACRLFGVALHHVVARGGVERAAGGNRTGLDRGAGMRRQPGLHRRGLGVAPCVETVAGDDMQRMRVGADADYTIERVQFARLQAVSGLDTLDDRLESRWTLFVRGVGQFSQDPLVSLEQLGIGGAATVRGYEERELLGDQGAYASVELRTPTLSGILPASLRWFNSGSEWQVLDRLQLLVFLDAGWVRVIDSLPGEDDDTFMLSLGPGLRYALSRHALLRLDWGFPLEETVESDRTGRGHLNFQLQF